MENRIEDHLDNPSLKETSNISNSEAIPTDSVRKCSVTKDEMMIIVDKGSHTVTGKETSDDVERKLEDSDSNLDAPLAFAVDKDQSVVGKSSFNPNTRQTPEEKSPPPALSQFSNAVTKSENRKGVQRNPRRLLKKPKVTYGRCKKDAAPTEKKTGFRSTTFQPKRKNDDNTQLDDEYSVFDFCSGDSNKEDQQYEPGDAVGTVSRDENDKKEGDVNKITSPRLNIRRNRSKRRRINMADARSTKRKSNAASKQGLLWIYCVFIGPCSL